jgi:hypothetical protein
MIEQKSVIQYAEEEKEVRSYHVGTQVRPKIDLYLHVTTRRLLLSGETHGLGGESIFMQEAYIQDISGISAFSAKGRSLFMLIYGFILFIIGIVILFALGVLGVFGIIFIILGLYLIIRGLIVRKSVELTVYSKTAQGTPIMIGASSAKRGPSLVSIGLSGLFSSTYVKPGKDAHRMVKELSACVLDLQADPENALKKWGGQSSGEGR